MPNEEITNVVTEATETVKNIGNPRLETAIGVGIACFTAIGLLTTLKKAADTGKKGLGKIVEVKEVKEDTKPE